MAVLPRHSLIGFLADEFGKSYYKDSNGNIALDSLPHRLRHLPDGFIDFTLKFSRNSRYLGVDRTFVDELRFVKDALDIVRHIQYTCRGSQSKIYFLLYELNLITGVYDLYDKLLVDLSQWDNDDTGVKTKLIQAGPSYYIKANENVVYEIPFGDEQVVNDGILLDDTFNYGIYQQDSVVPNSLTYAQTIGIAFLNNEGDNVGLIHGSQSPVEVDSDNTSSAVTTTYDKIKQVATSPVESITPLNLTEINIHLEGIATGAQVMTFSLYTKNQIQQLSKIQIGPYPFVYPVQPNMQVNTPTPFVVNWIGTASLDYDDNAFIAVTIGATTTRYPVFTLSETKSYIKLQSRNPTYVHPAIRPLRFVSETY